MKALLSFTHLCFFIFLFKSVRWSTKLANTIHELENITIWMALVLTIYILTKTGYQFYVTEAKHFRAAR